jgi:D-glycerate 3-kinase
LAPQSDIDQELARFMRQSRLPHEYARTAIDHFLPLIDRLQQQRASETIKIVGINGAQGTGKSTLARLLQQSFKWSADVNAAVLSIDDCYLTRAERSALATSVHPLLRTRGVPGTHDLTLLGTALDDLANLPAGATMHIPRFDKSTDDRFMSDRWGSIRGPVDLIILEGWCVGTPAQPEEDLVMPVNDLERRDDPQRIWRNYVNAQLLGAYAEVFKRIDYLVCLRAPDFDSVCRWRIEQESQLKKQTDAGTEVMASEQVRAFIQYFERLTRHNLDAIPAIADVVFELGRDHQCHASYYREDDR